MKYICSVCGYIYDDRKGIEELGIAPGTKWEDIDDNFTCPWCGASKLAFVKEEEEEPKAEVQKDVVVSKLEVEEEMSAMEMSVLCSNLARGCEKQYLFEESEDFKTLSEFFKSKAKPVDGDKFNDILQLINNDLEKGFVYANEIAKANNDRGSLRALTWATKVSNMIKSLLQKYENEGESMLENKGVFMCTACGYIYVGDKAPELCPVCKVPSWKFERIN